MGREGLNCWHLVEVVSFVLTAVLLSLSLKSSSYIIGHNVINLSEEIANEDVFTIKKTFEGYAASRVFPFLPQDAAMWLGGMTICD